MVAAIVIPILVLYFYFLSRREKREMRERWLRVGEVKEEALVKGTIVEMETARETYDGGFPIIAHYLYIHDGLRKWRTCKRIPLHDGGKELPIQVGDTIEVYGQMQQSVFYFSRYKLKDE